MSIPFVPLGPVPDATVGAGGDSAVAILAAFKADPDFGTAGLLNDTQNTATAVSDLPSIKSKTDLIGTIRSLINW